LQAQNTITSTFNCSLERAFKTPILGDATKMLTGYGVVPACTGFLDDETWGQVGGYRRPLVAGSPFSKPGPQTFDQILIRDENRYWKWQIDQFPASLFFAHKAQGEWWCTNNGNGTIDVKWTYTFFSRNAITHPITLAFVKVFWAGFQRDAIQKMKVMAEGDEGFVYE
jgi:hypothetical protein